MTPIFDRARATAARLRVLTLGLALLGLLAPPTRAEETLPTARAVIDRFLEVTGAGKVFAEHTSMTTTGMFTMPAQGMQGKMAVHAKAPDRFVLSIEIDGFGEVLQGYDGKVGWSLDPASGPQLAEAEALVQLQDQANFYSMLYRDEDVQKLELTAKQEFAGTDAYRIEVVGRHGSENTLYFSVETGLLIGSEAVQHTAMGSIPTTTVIAEYKDFSGVQMPARTEQTMMGIQQVLTIDTVSFEALDDSVFVLPAAVAGLVEAD